MFYQPYRLLLLLLLPMHRDIVGSVVRDGPHAIKFCPVRTIHVPVNTCRCNEPHVPQAKQKWGPRADLTILATSQYGGRQVSL